MLKEINSYSAFVCFSKQYSTFGEVVAGSVVIRIFSELGLLFPGCLAVLWLFHLPYPHITSSKH
jgi:hypothetical protein